MFGDAKCGGTTHAETTPALQSAWKLGNWRGGTRYACSNLIPLLAPLGCSCQNCFILPCDIFPSSQKKFFPPFSEDLRGAIGTGLADWLQLGNLSVSGNLTALLSKQPITASLSTALELWGKWQYRSTPIQFSQFYCKPRAWALLLSKDGFMVSEQIHSFCSAFLRTGWI